MIEPILIKETFTGFKTMQNESYAEHSSFKFVIHKFVKALRELCFAENLSESDL